MLKKLPMLNKKLYPEIIKPVYQSINQYSQGKKIFSEFIYPLAKGKYVALCEGDDFWTDTNKLQFQVDYLEEHPEFIGITHNVKYLNDPANEVNIDREFYGEMKDRIYTLKDFINGECVAGALCSFLFRNFFTKELLDKAKLPEFPGFNHIELSFWMVIQGNVYYSRNVMAIHRYIMKKGSTNWKSQSISKNQLRILYDLFPRLEKMAIDEFGVKVDLHKCKYAHFYQMVKKAFRSFKKSDFEVLIDTWKKSGNRIRYVYLIFNYLAYDAAISIWQIVKPVWGKMKYYGR